MGKRISDKQPAVPMENSSTSSSTSTSTSYQQGRAWGIFQIIKYHHWHHHVKKRLTHKRHGGGGKNPTKPDILGTLDASGFDNMQQHYEPESKLSSVEEMSEQSTPPAKQSVKARLKALITEEIARKKGQHKRSSTCPVKPNQAHFIPNLGRSNLDLVNESLSTKKDPKIVSETSDMLDELPQVFSTTNNEICVECGTKFSSEFMGNNHQVHKHHKQPSEYHALLKETSSYEEKSMHAKLLTTDVSPHLFKDFLDILDIINVNKDLLLKFLQHPHSPLVYHCHNQQASSGKMKLTKSISFPVPGSSSGVKVQNLNNMVDERFKAKRERQVQNESQAQSSLPMSKSSEKFFQQPKSLDCSYKVDKSSSVPISHVQNPRVIKRFKDLRLKVKHVIEESKNEKHRITMDAILHKIPHGNKLSKDLKKKILEKSKDPTIMGEGTSIARSDPHVSPIRTSSLNELVWRYSQLYETCFTKEAKYPRSERLKLKIGERGSILLRTPKSLQRFLSLPNLKTYFSQSEDTFVLLPPQIPVRKLGEKTKTLGTIDDQNNLDYGDLKNQVLENVSKSVQKEIVINGDTGSGLDEDKEYLYQKESIEIDEDFEKLTNSDNNEQNSRQSRESTSMVVEAKSFSSFDSSFLDDTIDFDEKLFLPEDLKVKPRLIDGLDHLDEQLQEANIADYYERVRSEKDFLKFGVLNKHLNLEIPGLEVDANIEDEFNYVRDVLELSGFTGHDSLGMWYSTDQPIDPIVYEELEGCLLFDPECSNNCNEDHDHYNHLLLFDLINEVLVEIFGRSYTYYPKPLSSLAHVHLIPVGNHVLREVWTLISWYLSSNSELFYSSLDYYVSQDLARSDRWMNLQFDSECVGLELDDLIFDDLLEEIIYS